MFLDMDVKYRGVGAWTTENYSSLVVRDFMHFWSIYSNSH